MAEGVYSKGRIALNIVAIIAACFALGYIVGKLVALM